MNKAERIKAEVERRLSDCGYAMGSENSPIIAKILYESYRSLLLFINSLEEEPVSNDLEEAATKYARKQLSNPDYPTYNDEYEMECAFEAGAQWQQQKTDRDMTEALRTEYEKGRADVIAKACQFLHDYQEYPDHDIATDKLVEAFKMYIEL